MPKEPWEMSREELIKAAVGGRIGPYESDIEDPDVSSQRSSESKVNAVLRGDKPVAEVPEDYASQLIAQDVPGLNVTALPGGRNWAVYTEKAAYERLLKLYEGEYSAKGSAEMGRVLGYSEADIAAFYAADDFDLHGKAIAEHQAEQKAAKKEAEAAKRKLTASKAVLSGDDGVPEMPSVNWQGLLNAASDDPPRPGGSIPIAEIAPPGAGAFKPQGVPSREPTMGELIANRARQAHEDAARRFREAGNEEAAKREEAAAAAHAEQAMRARDEAERRDRENAYQMPTAGAADVGSVGAGQAASGGGSQPPTGGGAASAASAYSMPEGVPMATHAPPIPTIPILSPADGIEGDEPNEQGGEKWDAWQMFVRTALPHWAKFAGWDDGEQEMPSNYRRRGPRGMGSGGLFGDLNMPGGGSDPIAAAEAIAGGARDGGEIGELIKVIKELIEELRKDREQGSTGIKPEAEPSKPSPNSTQPQPPPRPGRPTGSGQQGFDATIGRILMAASGRH